SNISQGMIAGASVASRGLHVVLDHELAGGEALRFLRIQSRSISLAMGADQQVAAGPDGPGQLAYPRHLQILSEVRENRKGVDEVESVVAIRKRRRQLIDAYVCERKILAAPL